MHPDGMYIYTKWVKAAVYYLFIFFKKYHTMTTTTEFTELIYTVSSNILFIF